MREPKRSRGPGMAVTPQSRTWIQAKAPLSAVNLASEQRHRLHQIWRHNHYLHGPGVVCYLLVMPARDHGRPWAVQMCPGYALGPCGEEIVVAAPVVIDVSEALWRLPRDEEPEIAWICLQYAEEPGVPMWTSQRRCRGGTERLEATRIIEGYELAVLWHPPDDGRDDSGLCSVGSPPCPTAPKDRCVPLARIRLPASQGDPITAGHIDHELRGP